MANKDDLEDAINLLFHDLPSKELRTSMETLIRIFRNVLENPNEQKYKQLKLSNTAFFTHVWRHDGGRQFMLKAGWKVEKPELILEDFSNVDIALNILLSKRLLSPRHDEWSGEYVEGPSRKQLREAELRKKAIMERDKELAEFFRDKEERKQICENVKAEHRADRKRLEMLNPSALASS